MYILVRETNRNPFLKVFLLKTCHEGCEDMSCLSGMSRNSVGEKRKPKKTLTKVIQ